MKRQDISSLQKNRGIYLKVGFILSLGFAVMALNFTTYSYEQEAMKTTVLDQVDDIEVVRTVHEQPRKLPPPAFEPTDNFEPEDIPEFTEKPVPLKIDRNLLSEPVKVNSEPTSPPPLPEPPFPLPKAEEPEVPPLFKVVEEMPRFPGCEDLPQAERKACADKKMLQFIYQHINYPAIARENDVEGMVVVRFVVEKDGSISNTEIVRDIGAQCGREAQRVVELMNEQGIRWRPGMQRGRAVRVQFNLPVKFELRR